MTGSGTQADPYIPSTLTELRSVAGTENIYVKLTQDIDANDDPNYNTELNEYLRIHCILYSEEGHRYAIKNICVSSNYAIRCYYANITNVDFKNIIHRKISSETSIYCVSSQINNCRFTIDVQCSTYSQNSVYGNNYTYFKNCAFNFHYISSDTIGIGYTIDAYRTDGDGTSFENCNFVFENFALFGNNAGSDFSIMFHVALMNHCMILFDKPRIRIDDGGSKHLWFIYGILKSSYIAFHQPSCDIKYQIEFIISRDTTSSNNILAFNNSDIPSTKYIVSGSPFSVITLDQLKDQTYLRSIGFLP